MRPVHRLAAVPGTQWPIKEPTELWALTALEIDELVELANQQRSNGRPHR